MISPAAGLADQGEARQCLSRIELNRSRRHSHQLGVPTPDRQRHRQQAALPGVEMVEHGLEEVVLGTDDAVGGGHRGGGRPAVHAIEDRRVDAVQPGQARHLHRAQAEVILADLGHVTAGGS